MKIRTDFVTNSSSSSYIIVFAKIDTDKAKSLIKDLGFEKDIYTWEDLYLNNNCGFSNVAKGEIGADFCENYWENTYWEVDPKMFDHDALYLYYEDTPHDEHEGYFWDEDAGDYIYDVDLDWFDDNVQQLYRAVTEKTGFSDVFKGYGAGRNG